MARCPTLPYENFHEWKSMTEAKRAILLRYGVATGTVMLAFVLAVSAKSLMERALLLLFISAVIVSSRYGGLRPALLATVLSVASLIYLFVPQTGVALADRSGDFVAVIAFVLVALLVSSSNVARSRAEAALRQAETDYRRIFENAITGIYQTTVEGRYLTANPMLARMFGYESPEDLIAVAEKEETLKRRFYVEPERRDEFIRLVREHGAVTEFESEIYRHDGSRLWIAEHALAIRDAGGNLTGFQGTTIDITDRKHAQDALRKAHDELEHRVAERTTDLASTNAALQQEITERKSIEEALRALSANLQNVREEERTRIAREIHDDLGQSLTALIMDLSWLEDKLTRPREVSARNILLDKIEAMMKLVEVTMETVRTIAAELRPGVLDELGLKTAIDWQAKEFQKRTGIKCYFMTQLEETALDRTGATAVFRILQESLTNVVRHAKANTVNLTLDERGGELILEVQDNGKGITEAELFDRSSLGILGMRERAVVIGGTVDIASVKDQGTRVTVRVPLK